jgi:hypothetical protein
MLLATCLSPLRRRPLPSASSLTVRSDRYSNTGSFRLERFGVAGSVRRQRELGFGHRDGLLAREEHQQRPKHQQRASTVSGTSNPPVESSITPVNAGPTKPLRLPTAAIRAMPAAAAVPLRKAVGSAQKTGIAERMPAAAGVIATVPPFRQWSLTPR